MKYQEAREYLQECSNYGSILGLDNIKYVLEELNNPQEQLSFVHISGTNGKGSSVTFISNILKKAKYKVGVYTSPAVMDYFERFQINGIQMGKVLFGKYIEIVKNAADLVFEKYKLRATVFEIETAVAFLYFLEKKCDIVILETGMGGSLDATNIVKHTLVSGITSIGMDHMDYLGQSLTEIAKVKTGIIKEGGSVVYYPQQTVVEEIIKNECKNKNIKKIYTFQEHEIQIKKSEIGKQVFSFRSYKNIGISMNGLFQIKNAVFSLCVIEALIEKGYQITSNHMKEGFMEATWAGRFEVVSKNPYFIIDGAHNEMGALALKESLIKYFKERRKIFIIGMYKDKEYEKVIQSMAELASHIIAITPTKESRSLAGVDLARTILPYNTNVTVADNLLEGVELATLLSDKESVIVAFGSLSYLGECKKIVQERKVNFKDNHGLKVLHT
ncbi:MAG: bifunctional folylpolyglutamate synthase/dihydrofolate synthase [Lachnospiraceae bacterium]